MRLQFKFNQIQQQPWALVLHGLNRLSVCGLCEGHEKAQTFCHRSQSSQSWPICCEEVGCPSMNISPSYLGISCKFVSEREVFQAGLHHSVEMTWPGMGPKHLAVLNSIPQVIKKFTNYSRAIGRIWTVWHTARMVAWITMIISHTPSLC